jgi:hypothetical protein
MLQNRFAKIKHSGVMIAPEDNKTGQIFVQLIAKRFAGGRDGHDQGCRP